MKEVTVSPTVVMKELKLYMMIMASREFRTIVEGFQEACLLDGTRLTEECSCVRYQYYQGNKYKALPHYLPLTYVLTLLSTKNLIMIYSSTIYDTLFTSLFTLLSTYIKNYN